MIDLKQVVTLPKLQRFLSKLNLGTADISDIGDGTLKGAISKTNDDLTQRFDELNSKLGKACLLSKTEKGNIPANTQMITTFNMLLNVDADTYTKGTETVVIKQSGLYSLSVGGRFDYPTAKYCRMTIYINGMEKYSNQAYGNGSGNIHVSQTVYCRLQEGDSIQITSLSTAQTTLLDAYLQLVRIA